MDIVPIQGRTLLAGLIVAVSLAACSDAASPTPTASVASETPVQATDTPAPTVTMVVEPRPTQLPLATSQPPIVNGGALPAGALMRIGIGYINLSSASPDGTLVAVGTRSGIYVFEVDGLKPLWRRYGNNVEQIEWSPDGTRFITGNSGLVSSSMWDARSGIKLASLEGAWYGGEFSADGSKIVAMHTPEVNPQPGPEFLDSRIMIYDGFTGAALNSIILPDTELINAVKWVNGDTGFVAGDTWDSPMDYARAVFLVKLGPPLSVAGLQTENRNARSEKIEVSPNGQYLALLRKDSPSLFWDMSTGLQLTEFQPIGGEVNWSPDSTRLIEFVDYVGVSMWNIATQTVEWSFEDKFVQHILAWSPDQSRVAIHSRTEVKVIDTATGALVASTLLSRPSHPYEQVSISWLPDGRTLIANNPENVFRWDTETSQVLDGFSTNADLIIGGVAWLPDGDTVVFATEGGYNAEPNYHLWGASTGEPVATTVQPNDLQQLFAAAAKTLSPDGKFEAISANNMPIIEGPFPGSFFDENRSGLRIIDAETDTIIYEFRSTTHTFGDLAWSPDSRLLAVGEGGLGGYDFDLHVPGETIVGGADDGIAIFDVPNLKLLGFLPEAGSGWSLAFSPDGRKLASTSYDGTVIIWQITY